MCNLTTPMKSDYRYMSQAELESLRLRSNEALRLREYVQLLREQLAAANARIAELEAENATLRAERNEWKARAEQRWSLCRELEELLGTTDIGEAVKRVRTLEAEVADAASELRERLTCNDCRHCGPHRCDLHNRSIAVPDEARACSDFSVAVTAPVAIMRAVAPKVVPNE